MQILIKPHCGQEQYWQKYPFGGPDSKVNQSMFDGIKSNHSSVLRFTGISGDSSFGFEDLSCSLPLKGTSNNRDSLAIERH